MNLEHAVAVLDALTIDLARQGEDVHAGNAARLARGLTTGTLSVTEVVDRLRTMGCPQIIRPRIEQAATQIAGRTGLVDGRTVVTITMPGHPYLRRGWSWGSLIGSDTYLTIAGSAYKDPVLPDRPEDAERIADFTNTLAYVVEEQHDGVTVTGIAFRMLAVHFDSVRS